MTKEQQNKAQGQYYLIKDYVVGFTYIADEKSTNILFGGMREERLLNLDYLTTMGLSQKLVMDQKNKTQFWLLEIVTYIAKKKTRVHSKEQS